VKTAFSAWRGIYNWTTVPFGIRNGPAAFHRLLHSVLAGLTFECCLLSLDDLIVYGKSFENHMTALDKVYTALRDAVLKLNRSKCSLDDIGVTYLGHITSNEGIEVDTYPRPCEISPSLGTRQRSELPMACVTTSVASFQVLAKQAKSLQSNIKRDAVVFSW
jgi:Reverse transcriptase (RNA-dependent DNA polymerase)